MSAGAHSHASTTCRHCREVIGVYEPMVIVLDGEALLTSRAATDATIPHDAHRYHETCFALIEAGLRPGSA